jgi:hypothetical protein
MTTEGIRLGRWAVIGYLFESAPRSAKAAWMDPEISGPLGLPEAGASSADRLERGEHE